MKVMSSISQKEPIINLSQIFPWMAQIFKNCHWNPKIDKLSIKQVLFFFSFSQAKEHKVEISFSLKV